MKKRKQSGSSDLRTSPIHLNLHRYSNLPLLRTQSSQSWNIDHIQPFFPPIECLFKSEKLNFVNEYGIKFKDEIQGIISEDKIKVNNRIEDVHIKKTMVLSPYKWMQGDYGTLGLPTTSEQSAAIQSKMQNHNNAPYVGALASAILSESGCEHFPKVYGIFSGVAKSHTVDISDDYEDICERSWFSQNIGKTFDLKLADHLHESTEFQHTRTARTQLKLGDEVTLDGVEELQTEHIESAMGTIDLEEELNGSESEGVSDDSSSVSTTEIFEIESCDCFEDDDDELEEEIEDMDDDEDPFAWAVFSNVPVQLTIMERCEGGLFELVMQNLDSDKHLAWLTQVIFALAYAQRNFGFVHNDLHSNNVMYVKTDKEFFYYNFSGTLYKVPTYGYLIKIIDFERAVMSVKLVGMKEPKIFMSDHFSLNEEAAGQYNFAPFHTHKFQEIKPNASFDLVRLATSLFWDLYPNGPSELTYAKESVFCLLMKWLTLEDGTSVLFGKIEAKHERFHGFELYKAIARYCRDTSVPRKELLGLKTFYEVSSVPLNEIALVIDA